MFSLTTNNLTKISEQWTRLNNKGMMEKEIHIN